jgi:hypothetical protein
MRPTVLGQVTEAGPRCRTASKTAILMLETRSGVADAVRRLAVPAPVFPVFPLFRF